MRISIITATYNSAATIADCVRSVNVQTHLNIEHIVVDGASKDNTLAVINAMPNRVTQIISEPDKGIYDAMNKGIRLATGEIIGFLHSDDLFNSADTLQHLADAFSYSYTFVGGREGASVVYGDLVFVDQQDTSFAQDL